MSMRLGSHMVDMDPDIEPDMEISLNRIYPAFQTVSCAPSQL